MTIPDSNKMDENTGKSYKKQPYRLYPMKQNNK